MIIANARDLGLAVRQARQDQGRTQAEVAAAARVSLRWLLGDAVPEAVGIIEQGDGGKLTLASEAAVARG
ncbi:helix-turn-helix domain-containing protein [Actinoplanes sichuanensis]|uniref:Helix-turn-helix domain-containing protein n=1 Tax=Actinoplanes sichuanensis TaxID=512349 RepID=A0ABW4AQK7_9ACTN|nr:hypothetical protein [Actinoplanes sichuanensis]